MSEHGAQISALDRPAARIVAAGIAALCALALGYIHRDDLFPSDSTTSSAADPVAICFAERSVEIDQMVSDGIADEARAALFRSRAEAMCQATVGDGNNAPQLPKQ